MTKNPRCTNALIQSALTSTRDIYTEYLILADFFRRCPDFPGGELVAGAIMRGLKRRKLGFTARNLVGQWKRLKRQPRFRRLADAYVKASSAVRSSCRRRPLLEARWERLAHRFQKMTVKQKDRFLRSKQYKQLLNEVQTPSRR